MNMKNLIVIKYINTFFHFSFLLVLSLSFFVCLESLFICFFHFFFSFSFVFFFFGFYKWFVIYIAFSQENFKLIFKWMLLFLAMSILKETSIISWFFNESSIFLGIINFYFVLLSIMNEWFDFYFDFFFGSSCSASEISWKDSKKVSAFIEDYEIRSKNGLGNPCDKHVIEMIKCGLMKSSFEDYCLRWILPDEIYQTEQYRLAKMGECITIKTQELIQCLENEKEASSFSSLNKVKKN